ncbi:hypothetical protein Tco_0701889 [Tanacetum coccineum]|uniref:Uncharacterized protein n=1 Tax=Tanacetum coccineum TaxID=301880 RepID=A0ABQ4XWE7_9ASTR
MLDSSSACYSWTPVSKSWSAGLSETLSIRLNTAKMFGSFDDRTRNFRLESMIQSQHEAKFGDFIAGACSGLACRSASVCYVENIINYQYLDWEFSMLDTDIQRIQTNSVVEASGLPRTSSPDFAPANLRSSMSLSRYPSSLDAEYYSYIFFICIAFHLDNLHYFIEIWKASTRFLSFEKDEVPVIHRWSSAETFVDSDTEANDTSHVDAVYCITSESFLYLGVSKS